MMLLILLFIYIVSMIFHSNYLLVGQLWILLYNMCLSIQSDTISIQLLKIQQYNNILFIFYLYFYCVLLFWYIKVLYFTMNILYFIQKKIYTWNIINIYYFNIIVFILYMLSKMIYLFNFIKIKKQYFKWLKYNFFFKISLLYKCINLLLNVDWFYYS